MSNIGSSAMTTAKQKSAPRVPAMSAKQNQFNQGTMSLLDEARQVAENAVGQGKQLDPMIYQMLGLQPTFEDHTADLTSAQGELDAAKKQYNEAQKTIATLQAIPGGKRSAQQKQQLAQLTKHMPALNQALGHAQNVFSQLQTNPKTITGFTKLDPNDIPKESPFSAQNPLNQAQATEAQRLNQYLAGSAPGATGNAAAVDPTLVHQYSQAESALRAKLAQRYGPDYENTSVGQMALQNFTQTRNNAFATWNQQQVESYNNLAFQGQANLQSLLANRIGLMREPSSTGLQEAAQLSNLGTNRLSQQQTVNQWLLGHAGVATNVSNAAPLVGGLGSLLTTPVDQQGNTLLGKGYNALTGAGPASPGTVVPPTDAALAGNALTNWAANSGGIAASSAAGAGADAAGMSLAGGGGAEGLAGLL